MEFATVTRQARSGWLLVALAGCSGEPPRGDGGAIALADASPRPVIHLTDCWKNACSYSGPLAELRWTDAIDIEAALSRVSTSGSLPTYECAIGWPSLPGSLEVRRDDVLLKAVAGATELADDSFVVLPARFRALAIDLEFTGKFRPALTATRQPALIALKGGEFAGARITLADSRVLLSVSARAPRPKSILAVDTKSPDESAFRETGVIELDSDEWKVYRFEFAARSLVTDVRLRLRHDATPATSRSVEVESISAECSGTERILVCAQRATGLRLRYRPCPPDPETLLHFIGKSGGATQILAIGGPARLRTEPAGCDVLLDGRPLKVQAAADGGIPLPSMSSGIHELTVNNAKRAWLLQPRAALLPALFDPNLRLRDDGLMEEREHAPLPAELADRILSRMECGRERRSVLWLPAPSSLEFIVQVEAGDRLRYGFGAHSLMEAVEGAVKCRIEIVDAAGAAHVLHEEYWSVRNDDWIDREVEIPKALAGERRLRITTDGFGSAARWAAIADPRIVPRVRIPDRPNIILFLVDTLRADGLSCYPGARNPTSPIVDELAADSYLFGRSYAVASWTKPTTSSLLTGLFPTIHGSMTIHQPLAFRNQTLAEALQRAGYSTWAYVGNVVISGSGLQFEQGFRRFVGCNSDARTSEDANRVVSPWLQRDADEPFFLYIHTRDPHSPYDPPPASLGKFDREYRGVLKDVTLSPASQFKRIDDSSIGPRDVEFVRNRYDEEVWYQDLQIGTLLRTLQETGARERTILVLTSDHGEEFHEHGDWEHSGRMWDMLLRTPLVVWVPPRMRAPYGAPRRIEAPVSQVDIFPGLIELAGAGDPLRPVQGRSFVELLRPTAPAEERPVYFEEDGRLGALMVGPWKLIWRPGGADAAPCQLFDLERDPKEEHDLAAARPEIVAQLLQRRDALRRDFADRGFVPANSHEELRLDSAMLEQLRAMGYVGR